MKMRLWLAAAGALLVLFILLCQQTPTQAAYPTALSNPTYSAPDATHVPYTKPTPQAPAGIAPANVDVITGEPTSDWPHVQQNESAVWANDETIFVDYNDYRVAIPRPSVTPCGIGLSRSTDGGASFTRILPCPLCSGHGVTKGDPSIVNDRALGTPTVGIWFAAAITMGDPTPTPSPTPGTLTPGTATPTTGECGAMGVGIWYSMDGGSTWQPGSCADVGILAGIDLADDDHSMMWVDNNCESPRYGRLYVAFSHNALPDTGIYVTYSDDGTNWSSPARVSTTGVSQFLTGIVVSPGSDGTAFLAAEHLNDSISPPIHTDYLYRFPVYATPTGTPSGTPTPMAIWSSAIQLGTPYAVAGKDNGDCGSYGVPPNWATTPNEGALGVGPDGVVHFVYAGRLAGSSDEGNIYYIRSTDNGSTWSTPVILNQDVLIPTNTRTQWMPSLSVTSNGVVSVSWYDRRNSPISPTPGAYNYQYWGRISTGNGAPGTWRDEYQISDQTIPQPDGGTPGTQGVICRLGEYYTASADSTTNYLTWVDGRVAIVPTPSTTPVSQSDIFFAHVAVTSTVCPIQFSDVRYGDVYYPYIRCLACSGIVSGYDCGGLTEPCTCFIPPRHYFRPYANVTRAQVAKIIRLTAGWTNTIPSTRQTFADVPTSDTFWEPIEQLAPAAHNIVAGYACGGPGEPCDSQNRRYYRPTVNATRAQLMKIDALAVGWTLITPSTPTFADVPTNHAFYTYIETAYAQGVISGYDCGGPGEPCPGIYFRPDNPVLRGQIAKIVQRSFLVACGVIPIPAGPAGMSTPGPKPRPSVEPGKTSAVPQPTRPAALPPPAATEPLPTPLPTGSALPSPLPTRQATPLAKP